MPSNDDLPPALSSMWRALVRGFDAEPQLLVSAFGVETVEHRARARDIQLAPVKGG